jgi:hypothetical protein
VIQVLLEVVHLRLLHLVLHGDIVDIVEVVLHDEDEEGGKCFNIKIAILFDCYFIF